MIKLFSDVPPLKRCNLELKRITERDTEALADFVHSDSVYRYLPTFLFERKYPDIHEVIEKLYTEAMEESLILGVFFEDCFCGIAELYGYKDSIHKVSVGYRLMECCWGKGIATQTLALMVDYLYGQTDIEIITASTMVENKASARVLEKNGFSLVVSDVDEDWGYSAPTRADKWIR